MAKKKRVKSVQKSIQLNTPIKAIIGEYHDYIALNLHEIVLDPTPEESERIWKESQIILDKPF
jgi:hypothetical protein